MTKDEQSQVELLDYVVIDSSNTIAIRDQDVRDLMDELFMNFLQKIPSITVSE